MTQNIQSSRFPRTSRDQAIVIIDRTETRPPELICRNLSQTQFWGYKIFCLLVGADENPKTCLRHYFSLDELTDGSFVVICKGVLGTTVKLAKAFFNDLPVKKSLERATIVCAQGASEDENFEKMPTPSKTDSSACFGIPLPPALREMSLPSPSSKETTLCLPYNLTQDRLMTAQYIDHALATGLWDKWFGNEVSNEPLYHQYVKYMKDHNKQSDPSGMRIFAANLHKLVPITTRKNNHKSFKVFPPEITCKAHWAKMWQAIQNSNQPCTQKQPFDPSLAWTTTGKEITQYIYCCIHWKLWCPFYSKIVTSVSINRHYCNWTEMMKKQGRAFRGPFALHVLIKTLHGLIPQLYTINLRPPTQCFPSENQILMQWKIIALGIEKTRTYMLQIHPYKRLLDLSNEKMESLFSTNAQPPPQEKASLSSDSQRKQSRKTEELLPPPPSEDTESSLKESAQHHLSITSTTPEKPHILKPLLACTDEGKWVVKYIAYCISSEKWDVFYSQKVPNQKLYTHYTKTTREMQEKGHAIGGPTGRRMFMKTLHGLITGILTLRGHDLVQLFPPKRVIERQWKIATKAIESIQPLPSKNNTLARFVNDSSAQKELHGKILLSHLFERYKSWCKDNGIARSQDLETVSNQLHCYVPCTIKDGWVLFGISSDEQGSHSNSQFT